MALTSISATPNLVSEALEVLKCFIKNNYAKIHDMNEAMERPTWFHANHWRCCIQYFAIFPSFTLFTKFEPLL